MASLAPNTAHTKKASGLRPRTGAQTRPSLINHPAFPAVVALWFAALLGLGSLILPDALFDRGIEASGIASAIPAAAPPLGGFARTIIALATALLGAVLGLLITKHVAKSLKDEGPSAPTPGPSKRTKSLVKKRNSIDDSPRPIFAHEELGRVGFGPSESALAESALAESTLAESPLPQTDWQEAPLTSNQTEITSAVGATAAGAATMTDNVIEEHETPATIDSEFAPEELDCPETAIPKIEEQEKLTPDLSEAEKCLAMAQSGEETGAPDWQNETLEDLSLFHLTQRLATSFEARKKSRKNQGKPPFTKAITLPSSLEAALEEDAESARTAFFGSSGAAPEQMEHVDDSASNTKADTKDAPIGNIASDPVKALTSMTPPFQETKTKSATISPLMRSEEQNKPLKNNGNEDALREALKKLQGFSGAA